MNGGFWGWFDRGTSFGWSNRSHWSNHDLPAPRQPIIVPPIHRFKMTGNRVLEILVLWIHPPTSQHWHSCPLSFPTFHLCLHPTFAFYLISLIGKRDAEEIEKKRPDSRPNGKWRGGHCSRKEKNKMVPNTQNKPQVYKKSGTNLPGPGHLHLLCKQININIAKNWVNPTQGIY